MEISVVDRRRGRRVAAGSLRAYCARLAAAAPAEGAGTATVCLVSDRTMRGLHRRWRGRSGTTDVLSFPDGSREGPEGPVHLGDVVISVDQAARQAKERGVPLAREIRSLVLHGWLHLLGFDHETDDGTMGRLERRLARRLIGPRSRP